jgi:hypothetical protein
VDIARGSDGVFEPGDEGRLTPDRGDPVTDEEYEEGF